MTLQDAIEPADPTRSAGKDLALRAILTAGLLAGTLDILGACISAGLRGTGPVRVLQAIASGVLGAAAFKGGAGAAALGLFFHFVIATIWAALFFLASRRWSFLTRHAVVAGLAYGIPIFLTMHYVVLPLSAITFQVSNAPAAMAKSLLILMFCVGLPIALVVRRFSR